MKKKKGKIYSICCGTEVKIDMSPDFPGDNPKEMLIGTCCFICTNCGKVCDIYFKERKQWNRNPKTQIIPDKRKKIKNKLTKREIEEIRKSEDF